MLSSRRTAGMMAEPERVHGGPAMPARRWWRCGTGGNRISRPRENSAQGGVAARSIQAEGAVDRAGRLAGRWWRRWLNAPRVNASR